MNVYTEIFYFREGFRLYLEIFMHAPPNQHFSLSARMNGTQWRTLISTLYTVVGQNAPLGLKQHHTMKKIESIYVAIVELC